MNKWLKDGRARYAQARSGFLSYSTQCTWEEIEYEEKILQMGEVCPFFLFGDWMDGIGSTDFIARMAKLCLGQGPYRVLQPADLKLRKLRRVYSPMLVPGLSIGQGLKKQRLIGRGRRNAALLFCSIGNFSILRGKKK